MPGESIVGHATINNHSSNEIRTLTVSLMEKIFFRAEGGVDLTKEEDREVITCRYNQQIRPNSQTDWSDIRLEIPPVCSNTYKKGQIIEVSYVVALNFEASGFHSAKKLEIPIVIGTEPLKEKVARPEKKRPTLSYKRSFMVPSKVDLPSENDGIRGHVVESDANDFTPQYPYFNHGSF